jgi:hypothetical protein
MYLDMVYLDSQDKKWLLELLTYETVEASVQKRVEMKAKGHIVKW